MPQGKKAEASPDVLVGDNRKARCQYEILDRYEAGLVLRGTEVKVLRQGQISLDEAYARIEDGELWLIGANIPEYSHGNLQNHEPKRKRKCLLRARERAKAREQSEEEAIAREPPRVLCGTRACARGASSTTSGSTSRSRR